MILRYLTPLVLMALAISLAACSDDDDQSGGAAETPKPETIDVEMTIEDFSFDPAAINIDLGDEIAMELANDGDEKHTFTLNEFLVDEELASGEDRDVSFTPNEPGEFTFFCRFHPDQMQGTIVVARAGESPVGAGSDGGGGAGAGY